MALIRLLKLGCLCRHVSWWLVLVHPLYGLKNRSLLIGPLLGVHRTMYWHCNSSAYVWWGAPVNTILICDYWDSEVSKLMYGLFRLGEGMYQPNASIASSKFIPEVSQFGEGLQGLDGCIVSGKVMYERFTEGKQGLDGYVTLWCHCLFRISPLPSVALFSSCWQEVGRLGSLNYCLGVQCTPYGQKSALQGLINLEDGANHSLPKHNCPEFWIKPILAWWL